jgi:hypothetical protein
MCHQGKGAQTIGVKSLTNSTPGTWPEMDFCDHFFLSHVLMLIVGEVAREYENVTRLPGVAAAALATTQRIRAQPECNAEITSTHQVQGMEVTPFLCATQMNPVFFSL